MITVAIILSLLLMAAILGGAEWVRRCRYQEALNDELILRCRVLQEHNDYLITRLKPSQQTAADLKLDEIVQKHYGVDVSDVKGK